ncbi:rCG40864 [Rattus norvegicus]|uniref:RCG40864 n=1 Tax=Rattus norvegicus TaxID=10116 RepID=A6KKW3_RAT|nr:rCG40864 [Rattus norvegicus]
MCPLGPASLL